jgi:adenylate cyclase
VRYVLEGSVRKAGNRVRITAQLIDTTTGFHLWSERYDRDLADIFALQSEISEKILTALKVELRDAALKGMMRKSTRNVKAQDVYLKGFFHYQRLTREDNQEARRLFERAVEIDPDFAVAHALLGVTYLVEYTSGWSLDPTLMDRAEELAERALDLDPHTPPAYALSAAVKLSTGRTAEAVAAAEQAVELNPNVEFPRLVLGMALAAEGRSVAAMESISRALRLNPKAPSGAWVMAAWVNLQVGRKEKAVELCEQLRAANPDMILARIPLAAHYESEGQHEEARAVVDEILRVNPDFTVEDAIRLSRLPDSEAWAGDLRKAGLKE